MYPIWEVPALTSGMVLGLIAAFHILPSHLSVSAMWFNVYLEGKAYREDRPELIEYIKRYTMAILIFSYIFGTLSGVGIWFSATVANPRGISGLIHTYVWGWATEWVFFIIEVIGIYVYFYTFGKVDRRTHMKVGLVFASASWVTMIIIVGILAYMLSPGKFTETGGFFDGFFNPTYFPQLFTRTALMFAIGATFAIAAASRVRHEATRRLVTRLAATWGITGLAVGAVMFFWYLQTLPAVAEYRAGLSGLVPDGVKYGFFGVGAVMLGYFVWALATPAAIRTTFAVLAIFVLFGGILSGERMREMLRKPYVISGYMYSNQVIGHDVPNRRVESEVEAMNRDGFLAHVALVPEGLRHIDDGNRLAVGRFIAQQQCSACHALGDSGLRPLGAMVKRLQLTDVAVADGYLTGLGYYDFMPPFVGSDAERRALATYLVSLSGSPSTTVSMNR
jgi:cytochrome bd-type quinol oxidase subunit 1